MTFQDLSLKFPGLSRTKPIFQDFPGPGNFTKRNSGLFRRRGNPGVFGVLGAICRKMFAYFLFFTLLCANKPVGLALDLEDYHPSVPLHCWLGHFQVGWVI